MRPDVYFALKNLVQFERDVREHFEQHATAASRRAASKMGPPNNQYLDSSGQALGVSR
jgi:hypothetical protein